VFYLYTIEEGKNEGLDTLIIFHFVVFSTLRSCGRIVSQTAYIGTDRLRDMVRRANAWLKWVEMATLGFTAFQHMWTTQSINLWYLPVILFLVTFYSGNKELVEEYAPARLLVSDDATEPMVMMPLLADHQRAEMKLIEQFRNGEIEINPPPTEQLYLEDGQVPRQVNRPRSKKVKFTHS
jgi:hypothetical protein